MPTKTAARLPPFQRFLDAQRDDVLRFLIAALGRHDADDAFQETFISALRAYPRLRKDSNLRAWVLTIAHNKALDMHRARARCATPGGRARPRPRSPSCSPPRPRSGAPTKRSRSTAAPATSTTTPSSAGFATCA